MISCVSYCVAHSGVSAWCYFPAILCDLSIFRNVQTNFTALKLHPKCGLFPCKLTIVLSDNLKYNRYGTECYNEAVALLDWRKLHSQKIWDHVGETVMLHTLQTTYGLYCIKIFSNDKVDSPIRCLLLDGVVDLCTVGTWSPLSSTDSNTREVAQLDGTVGAVCREPSSIQLLEYVGEVLLGTLGGDKVEISKRCLISGCTVL